MKSNELVQAISALTGLPCDGALAFDLGPGAIYLLELPSRRLRHIRPDPDSFPKSFHNLAEAVTLWDELVAEADRPAYARSWENDPAGNEPVTYQVLVSRRGATQQVKDYRRLLRNAQGQVVGALGRLVDDSFREMTMDALARRSWREVANTMTRRLLHDFNNTIAGIYSLSELYAEPGCDPQSMTEAMEHIRRSSIRSQAITKQIRSLVTMDEGDRSYFELGKLLRDQEEYLQTLLPKGARIDFQIPPGEPVVHLDASLFRQSILHLVSNAADACGETAAITLRLSVADSGNAPALARIDLVDNGPGFDAECLEKALLPFHTTKNAAKHPGLGLNSAANFLKQLGGRLAIANEPGAGACISLFIPLARFDSPAPPAHASRNTSSPSASPSPKPPTPAKSPTLLVYTWEDIARHPLLRAMREAGWQLRMHLEPGPLLLDLLQNAASLNGIIVFKSALDEKAEPLLYELGHAKAAPPVALVALGESTEAIPDSVKRNCGLVLSGSLKPASLLSKLAKLYT